MNEEQYDFIISKLESLEERIEKLESPMMTSAEAQMKMGHQGVTGERINGALLVDD